MLSPLTIASVMRTHAASMSVNVFGSGINCLMVGSRKLSTWSGSTLRPARTRASNSSSPWRCAMVSASADPRSSRRSRHARPVNDRSTPRKWRSEFFNDIAGAAAMAQSPGCRPYMSDPNRTFNGYAVLGGPDQALRQAPDELVKMKFVELPMLGQYAAHRAGDRAHHYRFGLNYVLAESYSAQHGAAGDPGGGKQAVALHHIVNLVLTPRVFDTHLQRALP